MHQEFQQFHLWKSTTIREFYVFLTENLHKISIFNKIRQFNDLIHTNSLRREAMGMERWVSRKGYTDNQKCMNRGNVLPNAFFKL